MGLFELLTAPYWSGKRMRWREPHLFGARVHNKAARLFVSFGVFNLVGIVVLFILVSLNNNPPGPGLPIALGIALGSTVWMVIFMKPGNLGGTVTIRNEEIRRERMGVSFNFILTETEKWPYSAIGQCGIVAHTDSGLPYSMLAVSIRGEIDVIGIPRSVDLNKLTNLLHARGLSVIPLTSIRGYAPRETLPPFLFSKWIAVAIAIPLVLLALFFATAGNQKEKPVAGPNQNALPAALPQGGLARDDVPGQDLSRPKRPDLNELRPRLPQHDEPDPGFPPPAPVPFWHDNDPAKTLLPKMPPAFKPPRHAPPDSLLKPPTPPPVGRAPGIGR